MTNKSELVFSAIIAAYNNEKYAQRLYDSIESQTLGHSLFEIIIVDDGSADSTLALAKEWQESSKLNIKVVSKENGGVASARNTGIHMATGQWLTFIDSDDILDKDYLAALSSFSDRDTVNNASMLTSRSVLYFEDKGITVDNHPLSWKYKRGDRLVSLKMEPHVIHLGGHSSVVKRSVVVENGLLFNENVNPAFEDADFVGRYLSYFDEPVLGLVSSARYYYRKRADGSSLMDTTWSKTEKFTHEPKYGHLGMLEEITRRQGYTPIWAQNMVLYALYWYFMADKLWNSPIQGVSQDILDDFWNTLDETFEYIESDTIRNFSLMNLGWYLSEGLLRHFKNEAWTPSFNPIVYRWGGVNKKSQTIKLVYSFVESPPLEEIFVNNEQIQPVSSKTIRHMSFGRVMMFERVLVVPFSNLLVLKLDGKYAEFSNMRPRNIRRDFLREIPDDLKLAPGKNSESPQELVHKLKSNKLSPVTKLIVAPKAFAAKVREEAWVTDTSRVSTGARVFGRVAGRRRKNKALASRARHDAGVAKAARDPHLAKDFVDAWLFIDRPNRADDNAEHLYRFVRANHPEINSWFMLDRGSSDWTRLESEGFRLIGYAEESAVAPVLNAKYIISSHMDADVFDPVSRVKYGASSARRIFLQHGMNMNDISKWLNTKNLSIMLTSSKDEYNDFTVDGGLYRIGKSEVRLTGLPRHDRLVSLAASRSMRDRNILLVVPTWRKDLAAKLSTAETDLSAQEILLDSDFYKSWSRLLNSEILQSASKRSELEIVFVLHDHLASFESLFSFGTRVRVQKYSDMSVQELLTSSRLVITDYSSIGTEAAIAGSAVVYYQYDSASIYNGGHSFMKGWFDYRRDGFGPVHESLTHLEDFVSQLDSNGWVSDGTYSARLNSALPYLDGSVCDRVFHEILGLE